MRRNVEMKRRSHELRRDATPAENILWRRLRARQADGFKFRRQHIMERFIVDLYCAEARPVVELDGESHVGRETHDAERQAWLEGRGLKVFRFWDTEVYENADGVVQGVYSECQTRATRRPSP